MHEIEPPYKFGVLIESREDHDLFFEYFKDVRWGSGRGIAFEDATYFDSMDGPPSKQSPIYYYIDNYNIVSYSRINLYNTLPIKHISNLRILKRCK